MKFIYITTLILVGIGFIMIYSTSAIHAWELHGDQYYFLKRQLLWGLIGTAAMLAGTLLRMEVLEKHAGKTFFISLALLVLVLFPSIGLQAGGARRWLGAGGLSFQPSEFAKLGVIFYTAYLLAKRKEAPEGFSSGVLPVIMPAVLASGLIVLQPDFGSAVLIAAITFAVLFLAGTKLKYLAALASAALPALVFLVVTAPYRLRRIFIFLDPWDDPLDSGYQVVQSFLAIGSGGLTGRGLGESVQKLYYLPESYTDFIFSIIGEEAGFIGAGFVLLLFAGLVFSGFRAAAGTDSKFAKLTGFGITAMIALQAVIHIGVVTGCLPPKGLPLPFISFGGSSLVASMFGAGLLANLARERERAP